MNITDVAHYITLRTTSASPRPAGRSRSTVPPAPRRMVPPATFIHLRPAAVHPPAAEVKPGADRFATAVVKASVRARGERFDGNAMMAGPEQGTIFATGADILRAAKKAGLTQ